MVFYYIEKTSVSFGSLDLELRKERSCPIAIHQTQIKKVTELLYYCSLELKETNQKIKPIFIQLINILYTEEDNYYYNTRFRI